MIPQRTVNVLRNNHNVSISNYGIDCSLYIPNNLDTIEGMDLYQNPEDYNFNKYLCPVWIEWSADAKRLRTFGIVMEDQTPIIARFPTTAVIDSDSSDDGDTVAIDVLVGSYIKVQTQYIPQNVFDTDEFEIVDIKLGKVHDAVLSQIYVIAPRRVR